MRLLRSIALVAVSAAAFVPRPAAGEELAPFPKWSEPRRITSGPHEHLLASYFAINSWSPNNRYVSVLETDVNGRLPEAGHHPLRREPLRSEL